MKEYYATNKRENMKSILLYKKHMTTLLTQYYYIAYSNYYSYFTYDIKKFRS